MYCICNRRSVYLVCRHKRWLAGSGIVCAHCAGGWRGNNAGRIAALRRRYLLVGFAGWIPPEVAGRAAAITPALGRRRFLLQGRDRQWGLGMLKTLSRLKTKRLYMDEDLRSTVPTKTDIQPTILQRPASTLILQHPEYLGIPASF